MALKNGIDNSYIHKRHEDGLSISENPNRKVDQILDSAESVFEVAIIRNQNKPSPVFFKPEKRIDSPFEDMFIHANIGLRKFNTGDFVPANIGRDDEANVCKARLHTGNHGYTGYLLPSP